MGNVNTGMAGGMNNLQQHSDMIKAGVAHILGLYDRHETRYIKQTSNPYEHRVRAPAKGINRTGKKIVSHTVVTVSGAFFPQPPP
jgi:hypothetical protein